MIWDYLNPREIYVEDLLERVRMSDCKLVSTPLSTNENLSILEADPIGSTWCHTQNRSNIGAL